MDSTVDTTILDRIHGLLFYSSETLYNSILQTWKVLLRLKNQHFQSSVYAYKFPTMSALRKLQGVMEAQVSFNIQQISCDLLDVD